jgi:hypothetical protein
MNPFISKLTHYLLAFVLGVASFWLVDSARAEIPHPANPIAQPIPIKLSKILPEDSWINNFRLDAVPLHKIDSNREYLLLLINKNSEIAENQLPDTPSMFVLKGLVDGDTELWVSINPSQMKGRSSSVYTLLIDFRGRIFGNKLLLFTENLELSSMDVTQYMPTPR